MQTVHLDPAVFLSIDKEWADAILEGEKGYEYRRSPPASKPPYPAFLYATSPVQAVVGQAVVTDEERGPRDVVIANTVDQTPHTIEDLQDYFANKDEAAALRMGRPQRFDEPVTLAAIQDADPGFAAPQNFCYLKENKHASVLELLDDKGPNWLSNE